MKSTLKLPIVVILFLSILTAQQHIQKIENYWQYDASAFNGWSDTQKIKVAIRNVSIQKKSWNKKEKRVALTVKTDTKTLRDEFIFCQKDKAYYYCSIEDDGGYIKIDKDMNIQLKVEFSKETEEGLVSELSVMQKQKNRWIHPVSTKPKIQKDCATFNKEADKKIFHKVLKYYPELTIDDIKIHKPGRYYDTKHGVSIVAPQGWNSITEEGDAILYLTQGTSKFMFKSLVKFWDDTQSKEPQKLIKKAASIISEISAEEALKDGDKITPMGSLKLFTRGQYTIGHFVLQRIGSKARWESYTLIWEGKRLFILAVTSKENELLLGEFLSSLGMESFCSEAGKYINLKKNSQKK